MSTVEGGLQKTMDESRPRTASRTKQVPVMKHRPDAISENITGEHLRECVGKPNPTILEIGANHGEHTLYYYPSISCFSCTLFMQPFP
uniref:Uncharacterized protein n=1 Tax=Candidatus Kentrum sp. FM TaxID=2126340 RepID=A0A450TU54_9GAMM|nr:MAG: hypothetical protein BECKFM1743C_GA0114222_106321 [Candidatus Kentron sp. FM]VFJ72257.1 MAG: hypothetical protein BECKFM1743A_GA0114220_106341 [Candidatus Kentron sp. FM]VFK19259.1 MAG: hypothetical protein BECKFM1743B_GA0114221_106063 [Candidatus Kentron sp. FM]